MGNRITEADPARNPGAAASPQSTAAQIKPPSRVPAVILILIFRIFHALCCLSSFEDITRQPLRAGRGKGAWRSFGAARDQSHAQPPAGARPAGGEHGEDQPFAAAGPQAAGIPSPLLLADLFPVSFLVSDAAGGVGLF